MVYQLPSYHLSQKSAPALATVLSVYLRRSQSTFSTYLQISHHRECILKGVVAFLAIAGCAAATPSTLALSLCSMRSVHMVRGGDELGVVDLLNIFLERVLPTLDPNSTFILASEGECVDGGIAPYSFLCLDCGKPFSSVHSIGVLAALVFGLIELLPLFLLSYRCVVQGLWPWI